LDAACPLSADSHEIAIPIGRVDFFNTVCRFELFSLPNTALYRDSAAGTIPFEEWKYPAWEDAAIPLPVYQSIALLLD
jgi:hypothetical protein